MIVNNDDIGNRVVKFGHGTIKITSAYIDEQGVMALNTNKYMSVGESTPLEGTLEEKIEEIQNSEIMMSFDNIESLEVLILKLQEVRAMMLGIDMEQLEKFKETHNITLLYSANPFVDMKIEVDRDRFATDHIGVVYDGDPVRKRTNREAHEDAAGMGLDGSYFASQGIDPDAEYEE